MQYSDKVNIGKIIENVPFYPQKEFQCGPASLASILNYYGIMTTPDEIAQEIFSKTAKGTLNLDMVIYARKKGLRANHYVGSFADLQRNIDDGNPVIVLVDYGFSFYRHYHFLVVIGYNDEGVFFNSGDPKKEFMPIEDFMPLWRRTNYWTLLIKSE
ncbi:MAG: C39 family peptidase [Thermodesulfovibrionales bacterium]|nr:C39 family peptidase [Thermodesulfovibrionales bacterium]